jgi:hypothetical protein
VVGVMVNVSAAVPARRAVARGRELEIIAVEVTGATGEGVLLVIHVMPTNLRGSGSDV